MRNPPGEGVAAKDDPNILDKGSTKLPPSTTTMEQQIFQRQQIVEELQVWLVLNLVISKTIYFLSKLDLYSLHFKIGVLQLI